VAKRTLTDRLLKALKPMANAASGKGQRYEIMDNVVRGMGIRVSEKGVRTFILITRFPGHRTPTRRSLGEYPTVSLEQARAKARLWIELVKRGVDPAVEEERQQAAELRKRAITFGAVSEDFIRQKVRSERRGAEVERVIRRVFMPAWDGRPITEVDALDVLALIKREAHGPGYAFNVLGYAKRLFSWAVDQQVYGLQVSPVASLKPSKIFGKRKARSRVLCDEELRACWLVAEQMPYPYGPMLKLLMLTGQRHGDVGGMPWSEIDLPKREWVIPAERYKGNAKGEAPHLIPLTDEMVDILAALPRFNGGDYVFTTTHGRKPTDLAEQKARIDAEMQAILQERGRTLPAWVIHDLRRSMRTRLSELRIPTEVAEAVIGHKKRGLTAVYDLFEYQDEKRDALGRWAARLRSIVSPPPANVVPIAARAASAGA
jgi:integrase